MTKAGELDWSELFKAKKPLKKSKNDNIAEAILKNAPKQPTNKQLFGHLVPTEEEVKKAEKDWHNKINNSLAIPNIGKLVEDEEEWANGKSFNDTLSREDVLKRNMFTGE